MYGLVHLCLEHLVVSRFGATVWKQICSQAKGGGIVFVATQEYDDQLFWDSLTAISNCLEKPIPEILEMTGYHFVAYVRTTEYAQMLSVAGKSFSEVLQNLDALYILMKKTELSPLQGPTPFRCTLESDHRCRLRFSEASSPPPQQPQRRRPPHSPPPSQKLGPLIVGMIRALGELLFQVPKVVVLVSDPADSSAAAAVDYIIDWSDKTSSIPSSSSSAVAAASTGNDDSSSSETRSGRLSRSCSFDQADEITQIQHSSSNSSCVFGLDGEQLSLVFPFHFVFDGKLQVVQFGPSLLRLVPSLAVGQSLLEHFTPTTAAGGGGGGGKSWGFQEACAALYSPFSFKGKLSYGLEFQLRGQLLFSAAKLLVCFVGSPLLKDAQHASRCGLSAADFALHDPTRDALFGSASDGKPLYQQVTGSAPSVVSIAPTTKQEKKQQKRLEKPRREGRKSNEVAPEMLAKVRSSSTGAPSPTRFSSLKDVRAYVITPNSAAAATQTQSGGAVSQAAISKKTLSPSVHAVPSVPAPPTIISPRLITSAQAPPPPAAAAGTVSASSAAVSPRQAQKQLPLVVLLPSPSRLAGQFEEMLLQDAWHSFPVTTALMRAALDSDSVGETDRLSGAVVAFYRCKHRIHDLIRVLLERDFEAADISLARTDSVGTRIINTYFLQEANDYLRHCLRGSVEAAIAAAESLAGAEGERLNKAAKALAEQALATICASARHCPSTVRTVLSIAHATAVRRGYSAAVFTVVNLLFLRFLCPSLLVPSRCGLSSRELTAAEMQLMVQVVKQLQTVVNNCTKLTALQQAPVESDHQQFLDFYRALQRPPEHGTEPPSAQEAATTAASVMDALLTLRTAMIRNLDAMWQQNDKLKKPLQTYFSVCLSEIALKY